MKLIRDIPNLYCDLIEEGLRKPNPDRLTVTDLISPPLIKHLKINNWDNIEAKASDFLWMILGNAVHHVFESKGLHYSIEQILKPGMITSPEKRLANIHQILTANPHEKYIELDLGDTKITGKIDFRETGVIRDFKITSVWSFLGGIKPEWEQQLNIYCFLCLQKGIPVEKLIVDAILRDWTKVETYRNNDYPKMPFISLDCKKWSEEQQYNFIISKIKRYKEEPTECTPEERWEKATTYAAKKPKAKRATRVFHTIDEANKYVEKHEGLEVEIRKGERTRCLYYCPVREVCPFMKD